MSLYNNFEVQTRALSVSSLLRGGGKKLFSSALNKALNTSLGKATTNYLGSYGISENILSNVLSNVGEKFIDDQVDKADRILSKQLGYWALRGGLSSDGIPEKVNYREFIALDRVRKNHFIVQFSSNIGGAVAEKMNLFVTDIDLNPMNISGEKQRVGGTFVDTPTGAEATEVRITTMDDSYGSIKKWFEQHCSAVVASDGSFGVPASYAITIKVLHGVVDGQATQNIFVNKGMYRAASYEVQLSRRDQAMQEVTLTFSQIDAFMR